MILINLLSMSWLKETKELTVAMYGGYCGMCRELGIEPVPYHSFNLEEYNNVRDTYLTFKRR